MADEGCRFCGGDGWCLKPSRHLRETGIVKVSPCFRCRPFNRDGAFAAHQLTCLTCKSLAQSFVPRGENECLFGIMIAQLQIHPREGVLGGVNVVVHKLSSEFAPLLPYDRIEGQPDMMTASTVYLAVKRVWLHPKSMIGYHNKVVQVVTTFDER